MSLAAFSMIRIWPRSDGPRELLRHSIAASRLRPVKTLALMVVIVSIAFGLADAAGALYTARFPQLTRSFSTTTYTDTHLSLSAPFVALRGLLAQVGGIAFIAEILICIVLIGVRMRVLPVRMPASFAPLTKPETELSLMVAAIADFLLLSQSAHVQSYDMSFRYFILPAMVLLFLISSYASVFL